MADLGDNGGNDEASITFLHTDLDLALTFLDTGLASEIAENKRRAHRHASQAYDTVLRLLQNVKADAIERKAIEERLALLKSRLEGYQF